jgi:choline dehydrogenase-like flavoprotein
MPTNEHYDVIIIGSGAGGGTIAWKLAPSGKRILLLERGGYLPRERDNWETTAVFLRGKYTTDEEWHDRKGDEFTPEQNYYVGGNTKFYGAALFRLRPEDFGEITHHGGISPVWPLSYEDYEPWYADAERLYYVHGAAGEDPTDGPRSSGFPYPAVQHEPRIQQLHDDLVKLGLIRRTCPSASSSTRTPTATPHTGASASGATGWTLSRAWWTGKRIRRSCASIPRLPRTRTSSSSPMRGSTGSRRMPPAAR